MTKKIIQLSIVSAISLLIQGTAIGQASVPPSVSPAPAAAARAVTVPSGTPSSFTIRGNILAQQEAQIRAQMEVAVRCIANATLPTVLRDPEGNVRTVPSTDAIDCARTLASLQRQLTALGRKAAQLAKEADAAAFRLERLQQRTAVRSRLQGKPNQ